MEQKSSISLPPPCMTFFIPKIKVSVKSDTLLNIYYFSTDSPILNLPALLNGNTIN